MWVLGGSGVDWRCLLRPAPAWPSITYETLLTRSLPSPCTQHTGIPGGRGCGPGAAHRRAAGGRAAAHADRAAVLLRLSGAGGLRAAAGRLCTGAPADRLLHVKRRLRRGSWSCLGQGCNARREQTCMAQVVIRKLPPGLLPLLCFKTLGSLLIILASCLVMIKWCQREQDGWAGGTKSRRRCPGSYCCTACGSHCPGSHWSSRSSRVPLGTAVIHTTCTSERQASCRRAAAASLSVCRACACCPATCPYALPPAAASRCPPAHAGGGLQAWAQC